MKSTSQKIAAGAVLALSLALGNGVRAQQSALPNENDQLNHQNQYDQKADENQALKFNRASSLIGMAVYNQKDEHLGKIRDLVFDRQSERVAYAVLATGGILNVHEKLLAVPLGAFTVSPDHKHLILRADKSKLETAMGIEKGNWPSPTNPSWGAEPFWQSPGATSTNSVPNPR